MNTTVTSITYIIFQLGRNFHGQDFSRARFFLIGANMTTVSENFGDSSLTIISMHRGVKGISVVFLSSWITLQINLKFNLWKEQQLSL